MPLTYFLYMFMEELNAIVDGLDIGWEGKETFGDQKRSMNWEHESESCHMV